MLTLKSLISDVSYHTQKYVVVTPQVKNSLDELNSSEDYKTASLDEAVTLENHTLIAEWVSLNKDDLYEYQLHSGFKCWYYFTDRNGIIHEIRLTKGAKDKWEVKLWFLDGDKKPNYSPPNIYHNLKYDTAIFNTYCYILINEILPYFFKNIPDGTLHLPATDKARYRLYKITLNNHLDKTQYRVVDSERPNELTITKAIDFSS
jgi:hypothetical protein